MRNSTLQGKRKEDVATAISGTYKDDDSKSSLRNLLKRQKTEDGNEDFLTTDTYEMLDSLLLPVAFQCFMEQSKSPELGNDTALQCIHELLGPQYINSSIQ